jgi:hypothetical protein
MSFADRLIVALSFGPHFSSFFFFFELIICLCRENAMRARPLVTLLNVDWGFLVLFYFVLAFPIAQFTLFLATGMVAEAVSSALWTPIDVCKETAQVYGTTHIFRKILREEGLRGLYRGYWVTLGSFGPYSALYFGLWEVSNSGNCTQNYSEMILYLLFNIINIAFISFADDQ